MTNQDKIIRKRAVALLAFGLITSLLPGFATAQEGPGKPPATGKGLPEMPMKAPGENSLAYEVARKPAAISKLLSDMESLENFFNQSIMWGEGYRYQAL